jgi:hypothetical protein
MAMATAGGGFGGWHPPVSNGGVFPVQDLILWNTCPHDGHRLWALMSDAFWVYVYKVHRCPNRYAHDWALCPYAHVGERARRRDPRGYTYLAVACPDYRASYQRNLDTGAHLRARPRLPLRARSLRAVAAPGALPHVHVRRRRLVPAQDLLLRAPPHPASPRGRRRRSARAAAAACPMPALPCRRRARLDSSSAKHGDADQVRCEAPFERRRR